jgi:excisionase family DNA binding protein
VNRATRGSAVEGALAGATLRRARPQVSPAFEPRTGAERGALGGVSAASQHEAPRAESPLEKLLTACELAEVLRLHAKTIERMARGGRIPSVRVGGRLRFKPSDIASWLAAREDRTCHGS